MDDKNYHDCIEKRNTGLQQIGLEIKDIVFDYFNIISKEYEMSFEKLKHDEEYKVKANELKQSIDQDYLEKKYEVLPQSLTKEKAKTIIQQKQQYIQQTLVRMLDQDKTGRQGTIGQQELMIELMKFDDQLYLQEGYRREEIDKAVELYQLNSEEMARSPQTQLFG